LCKYINTPLPILIKKAGYSQKHIIHLFKKYVGITPKYFQRIFRFNQALHALHRAIPNQTNWSDIYAIDYFDQAHFIKEFNHFTGASPHAFITSGSPCSTFIHSKTIV
jgi:methylphosphotriester-DNA--protein-cysteine methyltransferase